MLKTIVLLGTGAALGSVAAYRWISADGRVDAPGGSSFLAERNEAFGAYERPQAPPARSRVDAYRTAARFDDAAALESALAGAAERARSAARTLEIDALLLRLAELDASRAVDVAQSLRLGERFVAAVFAAWARNDADAALAALGTLAPAAAMQASALAMLTALGADREAAERVAAALPAARRAAFETAAIGVRAERDQLGTLRDTEAIADAAVRRQAQQVVARAWAKVDPAGALNAAGTLPENEQSAFRSAVLNEWASLDPDAVFAYLESIDIRELSATTYVQYLGAIDPARLFAVAQRVPYASGRINTFQLQALNAFALVDPREASRIAAGLPPGQGREQVAQAVANGLARQDPAAAIAWVKSLNPPSRSAYMSLIQAVALVDLDHALALVDEVDLGVQEPMMQELAFTVAFSNSSVAEEKIEAAAARLAERNDPGAKRTLTTLVQAWASRDHDAALDWAAAHADKVGGDAFRNIASSLANRDPRAAVAYLDRVPAVHRGAWVQQTASSYARYDAEGAITWVATLRGDPAYDVAFEQVLRQAAQSDPRAAAKALDEASPSASTARTLATHIASQWASQDPRAAAEWAQQRGDAEQRNAAFTRVADVWAQNDPSAAAAWARGVPVEQRDAALQTVLTRTAASGTVDMRLFSSFTSDNARQEAAQRIAITLARRDVARARIVADAHIRDPELRRRVEETLERAQAQPPTPTR